MCWIIITILYVWKWLRSFFGVLVCKKEPILSSRAQPLDLRKLLAQCRTRVHNSRLHKEKKHVLNY